MYLDGAEDNLKYMGNTSLGVVVVKLVQSAVGIDDIIIIGSRKWREALVFDGIHIGQGLVLVLDGINDKSSQG